jgi:hypothetical protein
VLTHNLPANFKINTFLVRHSENIQPSLKEKTDYLKEVYSTKMPAAKIDLGSEKKNAVRSLISGRFYQEFFYRHQKLGDRKSNDALLIFCLVGFPFEHAKHEGENQFGPVRRRQMLSSPLHAIFAFKPTTTYTRNNLHYDSTFQPDIPKKYDVTDDIMATIDLYLNQVSFFKSL